MSTTEMSTDHILLIGMMGSGKTTVGSRLAHRLRRPLLDSDREIQRRTGKTVPEIFEAEGEAAFRREERAVLADGVATTEPAVISVAGGAVLNPDNQECIRNGGTVIWLRASVDTLARRVGDGRG